MSRIMSSPCSDKVKFEVIFNHNERASLNRPAWTSTQATGMFNAHQHKHSMERGRFKVSMGYWTRKFKV